MFQMTADVKIGPFKAFKPTALRWERHIDNYTDQATIVVPGICRMVNKELIYDKVPTGMQIKEGMPVELYAGYDGKNDLRFKGFVSRINFKVPVEIECEGYSFQLKRKMINKHYGKTTVKQVLEDLIDGTDIKLSSKMPANIVFEPMVFQNYSGLQMLEFLKEKYLLTVFFFHDELYVGWRASFAGDLVKFRLNWNVIKDDALLFNTYEGSIVHIELESRSPLGPRKRIKATNALKPGDVKRVKTYIKDDGDKQHAANDKQLAENQKGYTGAITAFLHPYCEPGMSAQIIDKKYNERNGRYFVEGVTGTFSRSGGRQLIKIGYNLNG